MVVNLVFKLKISEKVNKVLFQLFTKYLCVAQNYLEGNMSMCYGLLQRTGFFFWGGEGVPTRVK